MNWAAMTWATMIAGHQRRAGVKQASLENAGTGRVCTMILRGLMRPLIAPHTI